MGAGNPLRCRPHPPGAAVAQETGIEAAGAVEPTASSRPSLLAACLPVDSTYCKVSHFSKLDQGWKFTPFFPPEANGILKLYCNRYFNSCEKDVML